MEPLIIALHPSAVELLYVFVSNLSCPEFNPIQTLLLPNILAPELVPNPILFVPEIFDENTDTPIPTLLLPLVVNG